MCNSRIFSLLSLGRPKKQWQNNIRLGLKELERSASDWIHLAQNKKLEFDKVARDR